MKIGTTNKIQELAPSLIENFIDSDIPQSVYTDYYNSSIVESFNKANKWAKRYFFGYLHDSEILSIGKKGKKHLLLQLNDIATLDFACALIHQKEFKIDTEHLKFPVEITSSGTMHLSLNIVNIQGKIHPVRFRKLHEYLYEQIIECEDNHIEIAFDLWSNKMGPSNRYLLLLSCNKLNITESQDEHWQKYFGSKYNQYYDTFKTRRAKGDFFDYTSSLKLIAEIDNQ